MILRFSIFGKQYSFTFKFIGLTLFLVALFSALGVWQYQRAQQKRQLIAAFESRHGKQSVVFNDLFKKDQDSRFYSIQLKGQFDNQHQLFLDNKTHESRVGYEVYTPFQVQGSNKVILVDRGWVSASPDRRQLPGIKPLESIVSIKGVINAPPSYFSLGGITEGQEKHFPLRVQYINLQELRPLLGLDLAPYVLWLDPADPHGFVRQWKVALVGPEKHILYTVQWFAFAISLLVIFGVLNLHKITSEDI